MGCMAGPIAMGVPSSKCLKRRVLSNGADATLTTARCGCGGPVPAGPVRACLLADESHATRARLVMRRDLGR